MAKAKVSMKLLIDTKSKRVLFAEAGKECVDFLFQILSLPVATIIRLLQEQGMEGSWPNLYQSIQDLDNTYIESGKDKVSYLKPVAPVSSCSIPLLDLNDAGAVPMINRKSFYKCCSGGSCSSYVSDNPNVVCPRCYRLMTLNAEYVPPPAVQPPPPSAGLVKGVVTYMVMDDLVVKPMSTISTIALLNKFNIKDVGVLEEKEVNLQINEALKLLKASHHSKNVLTDVFC